MDVDESATPTDDTGLTLLALRQENAHSLDKDFNDPFFWSECGADAAAGMAKVFLKSRCPTPYWRALVSANEYKLWSGIALARAHALALGEPCVFSHLRSVIELPPSQQIELIKAAMSGQQKSRFSPWFSRADGLPSEGAFFPDMHAMAALCILFSAVGSRSPIDWPDLPPRLGPNDPVPLELPGLLIDSATLRARAVSMGAEECARAWRDSSCNFPKQVLFVPDWACWFLANPPLDVTFPKYN